MLLLSPGLDLLTCESPFWTVRVLSSLTNGTQIWIWMRSLSEKRCGKASRYNPGLEHKGDDSSRFQVWRLMFANSGTVRRRKRTMSPTVSQSRPLFSNRQDCVLIPQEILPTHAHVQRLPPSVPKLISKGSLDPFLRLVVELSVPDSCLLQLCNDPQRSKFQLSRN